MSIHAFDRIIIHWNISSSDARPSRNAQLEFSIASLPVLRTTAPGEADRGVRASVIVLGACSMGAHLGPPLLPALTPLCHRHRRWCWCRCAVYPILWYLLLCLLLVGSSAPAAATVMASAGTKITLRLTPHTRLVIRRANRGWAGCGVTQCMVGCCPMALQS